MDFKTLRAEVAQPATTQRKREAAEALAQKLDCNWFADEDGDFWLTKPPRTKAEYLQAVHGF